MLLHNRLPLTEAPTLEDLEYEEIVFQDVERKKREASEATKLPPAGLETPAVRNVDLASAYRKPPMPFGQRVVGYAHKWGTVGTLDAQLHHADKRRREPHFTRFERGAFRRAIESGINIDACLSHDREHPIACTNDGTLELREDASGLWFCFAPYSFGDDRKSHQVRVKSLLVTNGIETGKYKGMSLSWSSDSSIERWGTHDGHPLLIVADAGLTEISVALDPVFPHPQTSCKLITVSRNGK